MTDLRILRTQKAIQTAFIELLEQQEFKEIDVQEIAEKALINRNTFYKHYAGKSGLVSALINDLKQHYSEQMRISLEHSSVMVTMQTLAEFLFQKRRLILALWKINTRRHHLYADMENQLKSMFIAQVNLRRPNSDQDWNYQATLFANSMLLTIRYYFEREQLPSFAQLATQWHEMIDIIS